MKVYQLDIMQTVRKCINLQQWRLYESVSAFHSGDCMKVYQLDIMETVRMCINLQQWRLYEKCINLI
jgi:hypothetical protein